MPKQRAHPPCASLPAPPARAPNWPKVFGQPGQTSADLASFFLIPSSSVSLVRCLTAPSGAHKPRVPASGPPRNIGVPDKKSQVRHGWAPPSLRVPSSDRCSAAGGGRSAPRQRGPDDHDRRLPAATCLQPPAGLGVGRARRRVERPMSRAGGGVCWPFGSPTLRLWDVRAPTVGRRPRRGELFWQRACAKRPPVTPMTRSSSRHFCAFAAAPAAKGRQGPTPGRPGPPPAWPAAPGPAMAVSPFGRPCSGPNKGARCSELHEIPLLRRHLLPRGRVSRLLGDPADRIGSSKLGPSSKIGAGTTESLQFRASSALCRAQIWLIELGAEGVRANTTSKSGVVMPAALERPMLRMFLGGQPLPQRRLPSGPGPPAARRRVHVRRGVGRRIAAVNLGAFLAACVRIRGGGLRGRARSHFACIERCKVKAGYPPRSVGVLGCGWLVRAPCGQRTSSGSVEGESNLRAGIGAQGSGTSPSSARPPDASSNAK